MATIKDVAALAGVSIATVSLVLNGRGQEKKVAAATQEKVTAAAKELGYKPNASARKLRTAQEEKPAIAFYWPMDYRTHYLAEILNGLREEIERLQFRCDLIVCTYRNDALSEEKDLTDDYRFSAAIIGAASEKDLQFLENLHTALPLVLFNRHSEQYHCVCSRDDHGLRQMVELLTVKGHRQAALLKNKHSFTVSDQRLSMILQYCSELGLSIDENAIFSVEDSADGGAMAARKYLQLHDPPRAVISMSDTIAVGASFIFNRRGLSMPDDIEMISLGIGDANMAKYATPSLSVVEMPTLSMAAECIHIVWQLLHGQSEQIYRRELPSKLILRESCPE